ncbi:amidohydrolase [Dokdonella sp.]|uniref:amidohydrolase n=1 Tax=Dokdonella sp. TaxID=2291710 RepID=UPI003784AA6A
MIRLARMTLCAIAMASLPASASELLVDHINGYSLDGAGRLQRFEALLVADGKVVATGRHAVLVARSGSAEVIDGHGRTLLPGLIDAHGHVMGLGEMKIRADLTGTHSLDDALALVRAFAGKHPDDAWIIGRGWNQVVWKLGRFPTTRELDAATGERPAWLHRIDGHAAWANAAAMRAAGIDRATQDPPGGRIERDAEGNPSGVFVDAAMALVERHVPAPTPAEAARMLDAALAQMASVGLTGVHDPGIDADTYALYRRYADEGKLTARIYAMIGEVGADFDAIAAHGPVVGYGNGFLDVRAVKLYADGALGSRGAALLAPYSDDRANSGLLFHAPAELTAMIDKAVGKGYQVCIHAIGDRANHEVLDGFEAVYAKRPDARALRNRIEHAQVVTPSDIPRFKALDLIASMQPTHATSDMNMAEDRVGRERLRGAYAWRTFLKQGTRIAGGSDFPVESANPFFGLHSAVTRQDHDGHPPGGWHAEQAMKRIEALRAFTLDAAWAGHAEDSLGTLEPGKRADFILVDSDYFTIPARDIWKTRVLGTWVGGKRVHAAPESAAKR